MSTPPMQGANFFQPLHRHVINLMCEDSGPAALKKNDGKVAIYNFSAFVVDIDGNWFGITAGHIFKELNSAINHGSIISNWKIDDSIVSSRPHIPYPIPLDINNDVFFLDDDIHDYAYFSIHPLAQEALSREGIEAIPQKIWKSEDFVGFDLWLLVGTPYKLAELNEGQCFTKNHATIHMEKVTCVPAGFQDTELKRLYAKIHFDSTCEQGQHFDISGMSGGPVFAIPANIESCTYPYRLIGIQSAWNKRDHVAICPAKEVLSTIAAQQQANKQT